MKNKILDDYIRTAWRHQKIHQIPPLAIRNAAIKQAHIERSMALVQFKTDLGRWLKSIGRTEQASRCDQSECSV